MAEQPLTSGQRVIVSYSAPQHFLQSPNWPKVLAVIQAQLPLRNIHWKANSRSSVRTIQELDLKLVPLSSQRDEHTSQVPATVLEKPLLNIYVLHCEDNDQEAYKSTLKKPIKDWHANVSSRKNQEWLILQIIRPDARVQSANFFQLKGSVLDKLRTDFNAEKRDRCVQVSWVTGSDSPLVWGEFVNKMKDGILSAFDSAISQRQEEVRRSESQQQMPGWNFCTFFILKESLATSYEGMNLFEDGLIQYEELETSFYHVLKEKNLSWFGTLINAAPDDDSLPLLSTKKKPYRDMILANSISVFNFRIYLLARQCEILAQMGQFSEITSKTGTFLGAFGTRLYELAKDLPKFFIESWRYSSALSVVAQCDSWATSFKNDAPSIAALSAGKGELLELARRQLDLIGVLAGHLPAQPPFSMSLTTTNQSSSDSKGKISNAELSTAIADREAFYELYVKATNRAIEMYAKGGRRKFALELHGSLAALDVHRGRLDAAFTTYASLPAHYAPHLWTSLESYMLSRALDTHAELQKPKDVEWIHIVLSFLKTFVEHRGTDFLMHQDDKVDYVKKLLTGMQEATSRLENDLSHPDLSALSVRVSSTARIAETRDGAYINVVLQNHLPCTFPADEISVNLTGRDLETLKFSAPLDGLPPGRTELEVFCSTPLSGTFLLQSSEIRMARLILQWAHTKKRISYTTKQADVLVRIPHDLEALDVRIDQSTRIELGKPRTLMIIIATGRNEISKMSIKLSAPSVTFNCKSASLHEDKSLSLETSNEAISLASVSKNKTFTVYVPHSDASAFHAMKIKLEIEYTTVSEPSISRTLNVSRTLITTLPISVNVEDFFRGAKLISKFTISTTSHQHVRICDAKLDPPSGGLEGITISPSTKQRRVFTVTPSQPANFLFSLDSKDGPVRESLTLSIKYRMLREEVESLIEEHVNKALGDSPYSPPLRIKLINRLVDALERDAVWVPLYGFTGELVVPDTEGDLETDTLFNESLSRNQHTDEPYGEWREIRIPVDVPYMNIVAAVRIRMLPPPSTDDVSPNEKPPIYAGQPISAVLAIHTSFHWGSSEKDRNYRYIMRFNIEEMVREWLVSGPKRGDFVAMDNSTHKVPITLIALHHGEFSLPRVTVVALPVGEVTMRSMAIPSTETYQVHGAEKVLILPRGGRSTFVVGMGSASDG